MNPKILIVDDEPDALLALGYRLERAGYHLSRATNGAEALDLIPQMRPDLILTDFMMPEMNGIELTRIVKSHPVWYATEIVLVSCNVDPEFRRKAISLGAADYLPKSTGSKAIVDRLEKLIGAAKSAGDVETSSANPAFAMADTLVEMLAVARASQSNPEAVRVALDAAARIAEELRAIMRGGSSSDSKISQRPPGSTLARE